MRREKLWRNTGWRACLLLTLCSLLAVPAATWGRYDTLASGTDSARVARPVVVLTDTAAGAPLSVNEVGTYAFAVSNTEAGKINETAMAYRITAHVFTDGQPYAGRLTWSLYAGKRGADSRNTHPSGGAALAGGGKPYGVLLAGLCAGHTGQVRYTGEHNRRAGGYIRW